MGIINISSFIGYSEIEMSDQRDPPYQPRESDVSETSESALSGLYDYFLLSIVRHKCFLIAYIRNRVYISTNYIFLKPRFYVNETYLTFNLFTTFPELIL